MAYTKEQLTQGAAAKIKKLLDAAEVHEYRDGTKYAEAVVTFKNTRQCTVGRASREKDTYCYRFLGHSGDGDRLTLDELAEKILLAGFENADLAGSSPADLMNAGFTAAKGTSIGAVANMLASDNYSLVLSGKQYYSDEYESGHDGQPYYGPTYRDVLEHEDLKVLGVTVAGREVKIGTQCVSAYVGD